MLACTGNEIVRRFFAESSLDDTLQRLDQVLEILRFVQSKKSSIASAIEVIQYAKSYAANVKSWKSNFQKAIKYTLENNLPRHEITIRFPEGCRELVLPEEWVHLLMDQINHQIHEWS